MREILECFGGGARSRHSSPLTDGVERMQQDTAGASDLVMVALQVFLVTFPSFSLPEISDKSEIS